MKAQCLHVPGLETGLLHERDRRSDLVEVTIREHIALDEAPRAGGLTVGRPADRMIQEPPVGGEEPPDRIEVPAQLLGAADMLGHTHRADGVEGSVDDVSIVLDPDLDLIAQTGVGDTLARPVGLFRRDRHTHRLHAVVLGCVQDHRTPSAADVEVPHPRAERQLAADEIVFVLLGDLERIGLGLEDGTAVGERGPQHEVVEGVGDVVVTRDGLGITGPGVQSAAELDLLGRRRQWTELRHVAPSGEAEDLGGRPQHASIERGLGDATGNVEEAEDVALDLDVAGDDRPGETELLPSSGDDAPHGIGRQDVHRGRAVGRPELASVVGHDAYRQVGAERGREQISDGHRRTNPPFRTL